MAYTTAQLTAMYTNVHAGLAPSTAQTALLTEVAQLSRAGQITDAQALYMVVNTADADTAVALQSYQFFTGKTPTQTGVGYLVNSTLNATDLNDPYYQSFSLENRYINFAQNLGLVGEGKTSFQTTYGPLTFAQTVQTAYEQIIGSAYATAAGYNPTAAIADIVGRQAYFQQVAAERFGGQDPALAAKAAVVGYIMAEAIKADVGIYAAGVNNFLMDLAPDNIAQYNNDLVANYGLQTAGLSPAGHVVALTAGVDAPGGSAPTVNTQGGAGDDVFLADNTTLTTTDSINGGAGSDRLLFTNLGSTVFLAAPALTSVERIDLSANNFGATTIDLTNSTGVTSVNVIGGAVGTGPADVRIGDIGVLNGGPAMTITADIDNSSSVGSLTYTVKGDSGADTLTVILRNTDTGGAATSNGLASLNVTGVETLTITAQQAVIPSTTIDTTDTMTITNIAANSATRLTITGDSAVSVGTVQSSLTSLAVVDASTMTKNVTLGSPGSGLSTSSAGAIVTTGSGDDSVSLFVGIAGAPVLGAVALGTQGLLGDTLSLYGGTGAGLTIIDLSAADQVGQLIGVANAAVQAGAENIDIRNLAGNAQITGSAGVNGLIGTQGNDTITGGGAGDIIDVQGGTDTVVMSALGQTGTGLSANGSVAGLDLITGMGVGDRVNLTALAVTAFNSVTATGGAAYLTGTTGAVALVEGVYNNSTQSFSAVVGGADLLFEYDTNGAVAGGLEGIVLLGSNAAINSVSSDGAGMFTFA